MRSFETQFEDYLRSPVEVDSQSFDETIWGSLPTTEQIAASETFNNERRRTEIHQAVDELLPGCVKVNVLERDYGILLDINKATAAIRAGHLLGFSLDTVEGTPWFPRWQFHQQADGNFVRNDTILDLWRRWGAVQGIQFCKFLKREAVVETYEQIPDKLSDESVIKGMQRTIEGFHWG